MADIPVRYVGAKDKEVDHLYGSWVEFHGYGDVKDVPDWAAVNLLKHPEFEDARHWKAKNKPIVPEQIHEKKEEEEKIEAPLVHLESMTKEAIGQYAHRYFGLDLPPASKKSEMINKVRAVMGGTPKHIVS